MDDEQDDKLDEYDILFVLIFILSKAILILSNSKVLSF
jgi:hypothetical protein